MFSKLFSIAAILYILVYFFLYKPLNVRSSSFNTSPILKIEKISRGYTLISPYNRMLTQDSKWKGTVYLLDLFGKSVHTWTTAHQALYSQLEKNGNLLTIMEQPKYSEFLPPGGNTGIVQELDWSSHILWEYKNERMHHDLVQLPNSDIVVALWEKTPVDIAQKMQGGAPGSEVNNTVWSDELAEINRKGEVVWLWHSFEHLNPQIDVVDSALPRYAWTYTNGISYTEHNPIDGEAAFLVSFRSLDEIMFVRKSDGQILWRSPKGMLNTQHDPTVLSNDDVMVFDNGFTRLPNPFPSIGSRVIELNPKTNEIVWKFDGGQGALDKIRFFAPIVGGAQRLQNGNTLITDGPKGHVFEVTGKGEVVWDMINPYTTAQTGPFPNNFLFKTRRYEEGSVAFPKSITPSFSNIEYDLYQLLKNIYPK